MKTKGLSEAEKLVERNIASHEKYNNWIYTDEGTTVDLKMTYAFGPNAAVRDDILLNVGGQMISFRKTEELLEALKELFFFKI